MNKRVRAGWLWVLFSLALGIGIYLFRTTSYDNGLALLVVNSLPDGLWMFSFVLSVLLVWHLEWNYKSLFWAILCIVVGIGYELGQLSSFVPGIYDLNDLVFIAVGALIALIYSKPRIYAQ